MIVKTLKVISDRELLVFRDYSMVYLTSMKEQTWLEGMCWSQFNYFRALAKETDGDFTKFVMTTRKPRDMS